MPFGGYVQIEYFCTLKIFPDKNRDCYTKVKRIETTDKCRHNSATPLRVLALLSLLCLGCFTPPKAEAISFALDSIAEWGKFPRFCVNVYKWGDKFFNSYDSTYVQGSGKRWNIKLKGDSWVDVYDFKFATDGYRMAMLSRPSTTAGFYLSYMAVSVGYDMNVSKYFGGGNEARKRFNAQFNCSLFAAEYSFNTNNIGTTIIRMGPSGQTSHTHIAFRGIDTNSWAISLYYFFNNKHYSQGAAFYYSKIQMRSSGTVYAGLQFSGQQFNFNFSELEVDEQPRLPEAWDQRYSVRNKNYGLKVGYAYNWVFHPGWTMGVSAAPVVGLRKGYINIPGENGNSFFLSGHMKASLVYNIKRRWCFGIVGRADSDMIYDKEHSLMASNLSVEISAGFRFDLW